MLETLPNFIKALRANDVDISSAESIDAGHAITKIGIVNRSLLRESLAQTLAKSTDEKRRFYECFDLFFQKESIQEENSIEQKCDDTQPDQEKTSSDERENLIEVMQRFDESELLQLIASSANQVQIQNIRLFTQRGVYTRRILENMGIEGVEQVLYTGSSEGQYDETLLERKSHLTELVNEYVDRQLQLYTANAARNLREEILENTPIGRIDLRDFKLMQELVGKLAKKLISLHSRRRKVTRKGDLDIRKTIRSNMKNGGLLFDTIWKKTRVDRPKIIAVCDVSGSVAQVSRFLLMFLYSLGEIIPKVRAFAFSNQLGEVTEEFDNFELEIAINQTIHEWGMGSTDYGGALAELERITSSQVDRKTTILILGDARSNYGDPGANSLKRLQEKSKRVIWLNPEPRGFWNTGDSEMQRLSAYCSQVHHCRTLRHLERIISEIARKTV